MSAEVGVHWRPLVSCNSPAASATTTSLPPLPDLIPIKKSQKCYDRLFKSENNFHTETTTNSNNGLASVPTTPTSKQTGSNEKASLVASAADCYEFVDELEFDDFNDGIGTTTNTSTSIRNTKSKCNSGGKKRQAYNPFVRLYTGNSNSSSTTTNTTTKCSDVLVKQERGDSEVVSLSDDVKKEKHRRSRRTNTHKNTFTSADNTLRIDYYASDIFDDDTKSRDVSSCIDNSNINNNDTTQYDGDDDANVFNDDENASTGMHHYTNEMHTKAIQAVNINVNNKNKRSIQQKHRKTGRRKQNIKKRKPARRQSRANPNNKKTQQQFSYQTNNFSSNCRNNNNNCLSVPRVNPIFLWVKQEDTTIVEVRCEDYDKRNRIRLTKTSNGWKATPRTEKSFLLPPINLELLSRTDEGSTSNVVDTEEETRKKVHKKHKRKKKKSKKERHDSMSNRDTDTTEPELKVPPIIVNIKQEGVEKRAQNNSKERKVIKVEALEPREPVVQCHNRNDTYDETRSFTEEFDNIEAHIPSHTISLAAINKDRYVHAHVSHNNNNNNDFISELGFNHQESQENTCIEKPIPNDISSSAYHRVSCGNNGESMSTSTNSMLVASPTPILIPSPPPPPPSTVSLVSNIATHKHEHPPSASLLTQTQTLENARVRNVVAATTQTMPCMESSVTNVTRIEMHSSGGGENRKVHSLLPNNNNSICETRLLDESGAACNNIQQQGVLRGTKDASTTSSTSNMCPDSAPPTAVYETLKREVAECIENTEDLLSENNKENVLHFTENKHLSDYTDCSELINEICDIQSSGAHDLMSQHCDNTMTGTELLDSLIEQRCEDNHISGADDDVKNSIYTISDDYNDEDDLLLNPPPVSDIISRLNETLASAPKCLSFNEAGEIEGLHGDLFDTAHNPLSTMEDNIANPFSETTGLDDLSLTIKNLTGNSDSEFSDSRKGSDSSKDYNNSNQSITILSADSGEEENPKDLSCKKQENEAKASNTNQKKSISQSPRPVSHSSDTIQSPQPSGLPAVPPSPELFTSNNNKNQTNNNSTKLFIESILASPKRTSSEAQQKEPLNLGKCRKSASPTVSCSEEIKKSQIIESVVISDDEPSKKRMKKETKEKEVIDVDKLPNPETARLLELLTSGNDPDPLTQFRLLISNPAWKVPDPLLVPKDRLNAVLASPAREIPLLLTTRPELRLPEAFAFPAILQDPDILVISLAQLERILHNQDELLKAKAKINEKEGDLNKKSTETPKNSPVPKSDTPIETPENTNDMTAAMTMFNQMLWLPYLQQMGQFNPEMFKAMMGLQAPTMPDMLSFMSQNRFNDFSMPNPMDYKRQIEAAMWQEAMTNNANLQRAMKIKADSQKKANEAKASTASKSQENARTMTAAQAQSKLNQMMNPLNPLTGMSPFMQPTLANQQFFRQQQAAQLRNQLSSLQASNELKAAYNAGAYNKQSTNSHHNNRSQQSPTQKKASNNLLNQNPFLQVPTNFQEFHEQQQQLARRLQKEKEQQLKQHQQQMQQEQKPRVTCKSLSNLMQPPRNAQSDLMYGHSNMSKMSNLMAMPGLNMHSGGGPSSSSQSSSTSHSHGSHNLNQHQQSQQSHQMHNHHHHQQQAKLKVKPGLSLLDPAALQRRLLSNEDVGDMGSGGVNLEESPDITSPLWHPLFGK